MIGTNSQTFKEHNFEIWKENGIIPYRTTFIRFNNLETKAKETVTFARKMQNKIKQSFGITHKIFRPTQLN